MVSHGATVEERDEVAEAVYAELERVGLADGDEVAPALAELFEVLARPARSLDLIVVGGEPLRAVAAERERLGVFAALDEGEIALEPLNPGDLIPAMLNVIGEVPPGPGERVSMPRSAYSAAMDGFARKGYAGFEEALTSAGVTGSAVRPVATMLTEPRTVAGQFAANGPDGRSAVLSWLDTHQGRYGMLVDSSGVKPWVTVSPADHAWLATRLAELLTAVS